MTTLIIGGANSGKSAYAEALALRVSAASPPVYLATMHTDGEEAQARIEKHRNARDGKGFVTAECARSLDTCALPRVPCVLLEDLGNLCANELYEGNRSSDAAYEAVLAGIRHVEKTSAHLVIVSVETALGGMDYDAETLRYLEVMGRLHCAIAKDADNVCEVVCGMPVYYKGKDTV